MKDGEPPDHTYANSESNAANDGASINDGQSHSSRSQVENKKCYMIKCAVLHCTFIMFELCFFMNDIFSTVRFLVDKL